MVLEFGVMTFELGGPKESIGGQTKQAGAVQVRSLRFWRAGESSKRAMHPCCSFPPLPLLSLRMLPTLAARLPPPYAESSWTGRRGTFSIGRGGTLWRGSGTPSVLLKPLLHQHYFQVTAWFRWSSTYS